MHGGNNKHLQAGFTIVELLIVVVVIAILAAITIVAYNGIRDRADESAAKTELSQAATKLASNKVLDGGLYAADWATAQSQGVNFSSGTTVGYFSNTTSYCLQVAKNGKNYFITSSNITAQAGDCGVDGAVLWMSMNGSANDAILTTRGISVDGTALTVGQNGVSNGAYALDSSSLIAISPYYPTSTSQVFSVSVWAKGDASTWGYIARSGPSNGVGDSVWFIGVQPGHEYTLAASGEWGSGGSGVIASGSSWTHLVLTYDGSVQKGYVNGVLKVNSTIGAMTNSVSGNATVGAKNASRPFVGSVDDLRVYNKVLSAGEVTALYQAGAF